MPRCLPPGLPVNSEIDVTIRYDESARVHVSAREAKSGREASAEIVRAESVQKKPLTAPRKTSKAAPTPTIEKPKTPPQIPQAPKQERTYAVKESKSKQDAAEQEFWKIMDEDAD